MSKVYELYSCSYNGKIVYIGEGLKGRHKHCNSGKSSCYELNKVHFLEGVEALSVKVLEESKSKEYVKCKERELIDKFEPEFNIDFNKKRDKKYKLAEGRAFRSEILFWGFDKDRSEKYFDRYSSLCNEFIDYFGYSKLKSGNFEIVVRGHYLSIERHHLASLSRWLRANKDSCLINRTPNSVLYQYFKRVLSIDLVEKLS